MKRGDKLPLALFLVFWLLYESSLAHSISYDGILYALDVEFGALPQLFHPNHLLYAFLYHGLFRFFQTLGYHGRAIYLMESLNALVGGVAVGLFAHILVPRVGRWPAGLAAALFGVSQGFWSEAIDSGCYAVAGLGAVLLLWLLLETNERHAFRTGLLHGLLILMHQMLALAAPAFIVAWVLRKKKPFEKSFQYIGGLLVTAGIPYAAAASYVQGGTWSDRIAWMLTPAGTPPSNHMLSGYWWSAQIFSNFSGFWNAVVESYVVPSLWSQLAIAVGTLIIVLWSFRRRRAEIKEAWVWILALGLFQFFFFHAARYAILLMPPMLFLLATMVAEHREKRWFLILIVTLTLVVGTNYAGAIAPRRAWPVDRERVAWSQSQLRPIDFLLFQGRGNHSIENVYKAYFAPEIPARSIFGYLLNQYEQPETHMEGLTDLFATTWKQGGRVWVEKDLADPSRQDAIEVEARIVKGSLRNWFKGYRVGRVLKGSDGYDLVELKPAFQTE